MKILQLCKKIPYPLKDGESIAIYYLSKGLVENNCEVSLLAINTLKHYVEVDESVPELNHYSQIAYTELDTKVRAWPAFLNLFSSGSYNVERFISEEFKKLLIDQLQENDYDFVQLETLYMAPYISTIRKYSDAKIAMRSHNLEYEIWKNLAEKEPGFLKSKYFSLCSRRLKAYEESVRDDYDVLLPISTTDDQKYKATSLKVASCVTPVGLDLDKYQFSSSASDQERIKIGYIGSLDWKPNVEGLRWLFDSCWDELKNISPKLEFHLAGRNGDENYKSDKARRIIYHGEVDDSMAFLKNLDIVIVPLFSGSGIRVKILEAMSLGKVVLSTEKGYEGIPVEDGKNALLFQTKSDLITKLQQITSDEVLTHNIG